MSSPINVDIPHKLGQAEAKRRIGGGIHRIEEHLPAAAQVASRWEGDRMHLTVGMMGQEVKAAIDVLEDKVHIEAVLPAMLGFFGGQVEALLRRHGKDLLEDKRKG
jgi:hypothetical protein